MLGSEVLSGLMASDDELRRILRLQMAEGEISFRFQGSWKGVVTKWIQLTGRFEDSRWILDVAMGDGSTGTAVFSGDKAEDDIYGVVKAIAENFREESVTN